MPTKRNYRRTIKRHPKINYRTKQFETAARKNLNKVIKQVVGEQAEKKQYSTTVVNIGYNASQLNTIQLTDVPSGTEPYSRIGNEVLGDHFEVLLNFFNETNNDLFVKVGLLELAGRGGTETISNDSGIWQDPSGNVKSYTNMIATTTASAVMWPYDNRGSCTILRERVLKIPKNNGGSDGSSRTINWKVPWNKKIRFINKDNQAAFNQSRRVECVITAWSPAGGAQTTYTFEVNGTCKFYYKDF